MDSKELPGYGFALAASVLFFVVGYFVRKNQNWLTKYGTRVTGTVIDNIEHTYDGGKSYTPVFSTKPKMV